MNNNIIPACIIGAGLFAVALKPASQPAPLPQAEPVAVAAATVTGPSEPYIVEYDISTSGQLGEFLTTSRVWSDGTIEARRWRWEGQTCSNNTNPASCTEWRILPGSSGGYACRSDIDGDRQVDFDDLLMVIKGWSHPAICTPHPEIECGKPPFQPPI